jgi:hypothetical protein
MRNCLYNGPATTWLRERAASALFLESTGRSLDPKRMRDREAINRFCAFSILGWKAYKSTDMDRFLAESLDAMNRMQVADFRALTSAFEKAMRFNFELFGRHAFRKSLSYEEGANRSVLNIALFDVCSVVLPKALDKTMNSATILALKQKVIATLNDQGFNHAITYSTNSRKQVEKRFEVFEDIVGRITA